MPSALGADTNITAQSFFAKNYADATAFLDSYQPLSATGRTKYSKFWEGLKTNRPINNMLVKLVDDNDIHYTWVQMEWPRAKLLFRVVLFTPEMFDLLGQYQEGRVTIKCSLQELVDEATKLEEGEIQN